MGETMEQGEYKRKYLSISSISMLGACETKFMEAIEGRKKQTRAMKAGSVAARKGGRDALPKITKEDIIREIKADASDPGKRASQYTTKRRTSAGG